MKIEMNGGHSKIYVIYDFMREHAEVSVQNARAAAEQYIKDNFPYREYSDSGDEISDCGFWSAKLEDLNAVYYHENDEKDLFMIFEFDMAEEFEYDCWYEDDENPCPKGV